MARKRTRHAKPPETTGATVGYEAQLWQMADALRGSMDAAEYKHVVLGLIFLKYISDAFEEKHGRLLAEKASGADPEDPDEYRAAGHLLGPARGPLAAPRRPGHASPPWGSSSTTRWSPSKETTRRSRGVLPKDYARPALDKTRLGELIDLISNITRGRRGEPCQGRPRPCLRVLPLPVRERRGQEGRRVLHSALRRPAPRRDARAVPRAASTTPAAARRACSSSRSSSSTRTQGNGNGEDPGRHLDLRAGVQLHHLATREDEPRHPRHRRPDLAQRRHLPRRPPPRPEGRLHPRQSPVQRLATGAASACARTSAGSTACPPAGNANYAWVQHIVHHLAPAGIAGFVLANGSMSSNQSGEGDIRKAIIEADLVDCMVALPGQLFYSTQIPVCLWFLARDQQERRLP